MGNMGIHRYRRAYCNGVCTVKQICPQPISFSVCLIGTIVSFLSLSLFGSAAEAGFGHNSGHPSAHQGDSSRKQRGPTHTGPTHPRPTQPRLKLKPWDLVVFHYPVPFSKLPSRETMKENRRWLWPRRLGFLHHVRHSNADFLRKPGLDYRMAMHPSVVVRAKDLPEHLVKPTLKHYAQQNSGNDNQLMLVEAMMPKGVILSPLYADRLRNDPNCRVLRPVVSHPNPETALALINFALGENPRGAPIKVTTNMNWADHVGWIDAFVKQARHNNHNVDALSALPQGVASNDHRSTPQQWTTWCAGLSDAVHRAYGVPLAAPITFNKLHMAPLLKRDGAHQLSALRDTYNAQVKRALNGRSALVERLTIGKSDLPAVLADIQKFFGTRQTIVGYNHLNDPTIFTEHFFLATRPNGTAAYEEVPRGKWF